MTRERCLTDRAFSDFSRDLVLRGLRGERQRTLQDCSAWSAVMKTEGGGIGWLVSAGLRMRNS